SSFLERRSGESSCPRLGGVLKSSRRRRGGGDLDSPRRPLLGGGSDGLRRLRWYSRRLESIGDSLFVSEESESERSESESDSVDESDEDDSASNIARRCSIMSFGAFCESRVDENLFI